MDIKEAIEWIGEGHAEFGVEEARKVCQAFGFELPDGLIDKWTGQKDANPDNDPKGLWLYEDKAGEGVMSYRLSNFIVRKLELKSPDYFGRGSQARANAEVVRKHFGIKEVEIK